MCWQIAYNNSHTVVVHMSNTFFNAFIYFFPSLSLFFIVNNSSDSFIGLSNFYNLRFVLYFVTTASRKHVTGNTSLPRARSRWRAATCEGDSPAAGHSLEEHVQNTM